MHAIHTTDIEGEGCSLSKQGQTHSQILTAESVLSWQYPQAPTQEVHAQTASAELEAILGKPDAIKVVAPTHIVDVELDLKLGELGNTNVNTPEGVAHAEPDSPPGEGIDPNTNAPAHVEGAEPELLMDVEGDQLLEEGTAGENAVSKRTGILVSSCKSPGLATLLRWRKPKFPTLLSPSPTTFEAARMQHSLAINAGTPDTPGPAL